MRQTISPQKVTALRSMKKTAIIIMLLFNLTGPAAAKEISETLEFDYQTTRKYLKELSLLGLVTETRTGWILLQAGVQLILPANATPIPDSAIFSRSDSLPSAACPPSILLQEEEEEEETRDYRVDQCLETLEELGITATNQVLTILKDERITPEYIESQAERLEKEDRWSTGLLLTVLRCFDPIPQGSKAKRMSTDGSRYVNSKYKDWIKH